MELKLSLTTAEAQRLWECYLEGRPIPVIDGPDVSLHRKMKQLARDANDKAGTEKIEEDRK